MPIIEQLLGTKEDVVDTSCEVKKGTVLADCFHQSRRKVMPWFKDTRSYSNKKHDGLSHIKGNKEICRMMIILSICDEIS